MLRIQPKIAAKAAQATSKFTPAQEELIRCNGARFEEPLLFMHTKKAGNAGHPEDRLFLVVGYEKIEPDADGGLRDPMTRRWVRSLYLLAWKCTITAEGIIHPEFHTRDGRGYCKYQPLSVDDVIKKGNIMGKKAEPTAFFKPDSFYKQLTVDDVKALVIEAGITKAALPPDPSEEIRRKALAKLTNKEKEVLGLK